jgi:hypothetical protein
MQAATSHWNSLEVVKLFISTLTPLLVVIIGFLISRRLKRLDSLQWKNQKVTEKRIAVFEQLAPLLNDVFCYFMRVGGWKEMEPPGVVSKKRAMDRIVHVNRPLFSPAFFVSYQSFIDTCYSVYTGPGRDAELRTSYVEHEQRFGDSWKLEWNNCFAQRDLSDPNQVESQYQLLMSSFSAEIGIGAGDHER